MINETINITCIECASEGFKRITINKNSMDVSALECINCKTILYDHATMLQLQARKEQSATVEA